MLRNHSIRFRAMTGFAVFIAALCVADACKPRLTDAELRGAGGSKASGDDAAFLNACVQPRLYIANTGDSLGRNGRSGGEALALADPAATSDVGAAAFEAFSHACTECHGPLATKGKLGDVSNFAIASKFRASILERVGIKKDMPEKGAAVEISEAERKAIVAWAKNPSPEPFPGQGAAPVLDSNIDVVGYDHEADSVLLTPSFEMISPAAAIACVKKDFESLRPDDRDNVRYVSFAHLYNSNVRGEAWIIRKKAFYKALNSVSRAETVKNTGILPIDSLTMTLFRVDLRAFGIEAEAWDRLRGAVTTTGTVYPYAPGIGFNNRGAVSGADQDLGTLMPIRGDFLIRELLQPVKYYDIMGIQLGANVNDFLDARFGGGRETVSKVRNKKNVSRAVFDDSKQNKGGYRAVEKMPLNGTAIWTLFDFDAKLDPGNFHKDPTIAPLGPCFKDALPPFETCSANPGQFTFTHDASEGVFQLPNGLFGYFVANQDGKIVGENKVTVDSNQFEHKNIAGLSCISCHATGLQPFKDVAGIQARQDQILEKSKKNNASAEVYGAIERIHPKSLDFNAYINDSNRKYADALKLMGIEAKNMSPEPISIVVGAFEAPVTREVAAAELGITQAQLVTAITGNARLKALLGALLNDQATPVKGQNALGKDASTGHTVPRDQFQDKFLEILELVNGGQSSGEGSAAVKCEINGSSYLPKSGDRWYGSLTKNSLLPNGYDLSICEKAIAAAKYGVICSLDESGMVAIYRLRDTVKIGGSVSYINGIDECFEMSSAGASRICIFSPKAAYTAYNLDGSVIRTEYASKEDCLANRGGEAPPLKDYGARQKCTEDCGGKKANCLAGKTAEFQKLECLVSYNECLKKCN